MPQIEFMKILIDNDFGEKSSDQQVYGHKISFYLSVMKEWSGAQ